MKQSALKKIYIVIPAYNESKVIGSVISELQKEEYKNIVVIDDGSKDNTSRVVKEKKAILLRHCINLGQGAALQTGFEYCKKTGAEVVVTYDADGQFSAKDIKKMILPIVQNKVDITLGSRFLGNTINLSFIRKTLLKAGIIFTWIFSGIKLTDTHNGFRVLNKKALQKIYITHNGMAHASEIIDQIIRNKLSYVEVPVTVTYSDYSKRKGQSGLNSLRIVGQLLIQRFS